MITISQIRKVAMSLPHVEERPSYGGRPSWRCGPRMFTWVPDEPESLVVWVESIEDKSALIDESPDRFFTTNHYDNYPIVLARLATIDIDEAAELITESWRLRAPKKHLHAHDRNGTPST
jgi:hypothetical protein